MWAALLEGDASRRCCSLAWQRHRFSSAGRTQICSARTDGRTDAQRLIGGVMHVRCTYSRPLKRSSEPPAPDRTWSVRSAGGYGAAKSVCFAFGDSDGAN